MVEDCCCDYETVDAINEEVLNPILQDLVALPFFRYFKVRRFSLSCFFNRLVCVTLAYGSEMYVRMFRIVMARSTC
jgi:hypothetical protein